MVVAQEPAEAGSTEKSALLLADGRPRVDQGAIEALVVPLSVVVLDVLSNRVAEVPFAQDHHATEALVLDRAHEALGVGVEVRASARQGHDLDSAVPKKFLEGCGEERIPVEDQVGLALEEAVKSLSRLRAT